MYSKIKFSGLPSTMASLQVAFTVKPGQAYWQAIDCINNHKLNLLVITTVLRY